MGAYIVGMITGAICLVSPLVYLMNVDDGVAKILAKDPGGNAARFLTYTHYHVAYYIAVVGAIVLLLSALMMVFTGLTQLRERRKKLTATVPAAEQEPPAL